MMSSQSDVPESTSGFWVVLCSRNVLLCAGQSDEYVSIPQSFLGQAFCFLFFLFLLLLHSLLVLSWYFFVLLRFLFFLFLPPNT